MVKVSKERIPYQTTWFESIYMRNLSVNKGLIIHNIYIYMYIYVCVCKKGTLNIYKVNQYKKDQSKL